MIEMASAERARGRAPAQLIETRRRPWKQVFFAVLAVLIAVLSGSPPGRAQNALSIEQQIAAVQSTMDDAVARVKAIVNQPITHLTRTPDMRVGVFSPGWFHEGAIKPDFATVDIRTTQELPYAKYTYVTSDLNPDEVFIGGQLEFNSMTKYFYTDRTVPKKRLTEAEMLEINQLYRTIAQSAQKIEQLKGQEGFSITRMSGFTVGAALIVIGLVLGGAYLLLPARR